jgi:hypothetical protein
MADLIAAGVDERETAERAAEEVYRVLVLGLAPVGDELQCCPWLPEQFGEVILTGIPGRWGHAPTPRAPVRGRRRHLRFRRSRSDSTLHAQSDDGVASAGDPQFLPYVRGRLLRDGSLVTREVSL